MLVQLQRRKAHLRLGLFMLDLKSRHWLRQSCSTTSCCTLGVAVAVRAISGTAGYLRGQHPIVSQAAGTSCMSDGGQPEQN